MSAEANTLTLLPRQYDKLGILRCGVSREGCVVIAGDPCEIADGEEITFDRVKVKVKRSGSTYSFSRLS